MFHSPSINRIESDEGFSVEILGRTGLLYREGDRSVLMDAELLSGRAGIAVYGRSIKQWKTSGQGLINETERERIIDNIRRALLFQSCPMEVIG